MVSDIAIKADSVYKDFLLPHEKTTSLKGGFTSFLRSKDKRVEKQHALKNISFEIKKGEFFGIVGRNGSGKSTLLKILAGIYQPTKGSVYTAGKLVPFIELGVGFNPELTGRDNIYLNGAMLGFSKKEVSAMYEDIVSFAELERFMDQKLKNYSSGMQVRLAFSMAIRAEADILLVDEVLAVGDADFQRKCFGYFKELNAKNKTVIFVTHDMNAIREYCDRAILIENSSLKKVGDAETIATAYTKMFFEKEKIQKKVSGKRWGSKEVSIDAVKIYPSTLKDSNTNLEIEVVFTAHRDIDNPVVGFHIKNQAAQPILGTNNKIERIDIGPLKAGSKYKIIWTVPHIFGKGLYYVDPAIIEAGSNAVFDWWEEAGSFVVHKDRTTPYPVYPPVGLSYELSN